MAFTWVQTLERLDAADLTELRTNIDVVKDNLTHCTTYMATFDSSLHGNYHTSYRTDQDNDFDTGFHNTRNVTYRNAINVTARTSHYPGYDVTQNTGNCPDNDSVDRNPYYASWNNDLNSGQLAGQCGTYDNGQNTSQDGSHWIYFSGYQFSN